MRVEQKELYIQQHQEEVNNRAYEVEPQREDEHTEPHWQEPSFIATIFIALIMAGVFYIVLKRKR